MTFTEKHQKLNELILEARKSWNPEDLMTDYDVYITTSEFVVQATLKMQDIINGFTTENSKQQIEDFTDLLLQRDKVINKVVFC